MIGIIFIGDLKYCPYLDKYTSILNTHNKPYEVLFWHRENTKIDYPINYKFYNKKSELNKKPIRKLRDFIGFRNWLDKELSFSKYDKLIILSTLSGIFIFDKLITKYKNKFIFDIRDYSYEYIKPFAFIEELIIKNSYFTAISSNGFKDFLPRQYNYKIVHNLSSSDMLVDSKFKRNINQPIRLVFNGVIRYFDYQCKIINKLANDSRFKLIYHGDGPDLHKFKKYIVEKKINNVFFTGSYNNSRKKELLQEADILNNSYGYLEKKLSNKVKYAVSNKYYDGIIFRIPQLVEVGTYKCKLVEESGIGISLDVNDNEFSDKLYNYYKSIDAEKFNNICSSLIKKYIQEDIVFSDAILRFLENQ